MLARAVPSSPAPDSWRALAAWLIVVGLAAFITYHNARTAQAQRTRDAEVDDVRIRLAAEQMIAFRSVGMLGRPTPSKALTPSQERMIRQLDQTARAPRDTLHVAIVAGEVLGGTDAVRRLDALAGRPMAADLAADLDSLRAIYTGHAAALDPASRARLLERHDYFGRVALSFGVPAQNEPRRTIESGARRALIGFGFVVLLIVGLLLGALASFLAAIVLWAKRRLHPMYVPNPAANTAFLEGFAIYFTLFTVVFGLLRRYFRLENLQWEWLAWLIIPVVTGWFSLRGVTAEERRQALGWHTGKGVLREIGAGIFGYLAGIVVTIAGLVVTFVLIERSGATPEHPLVQLLQGDGWHILGLYAIVSVFAPVIEETMFRGALFHHLRRRWSWAASAPVVAFIFAIIHPQGWVAVPVLGSIAIVLAALREWRGSLIAPMVAHAFNNGVVLTIALAVLR